MDGAHHAGGTRRPGVTVPSQSLIRLQTVVRNHPAQRLLALDAFRGIAIAAMILVNNPGSWTEVYKPLRHARWNGWTPADCIFPFFLFIVGVAIAFSVAPQASLGEPRRRIVLKVLRRTLTIFALGIFLNGFPRFDWSVLRIPGVLQRIALCYGVASMTVLTLGIRGQGLTAAALVVGYGALMACVRVPGQAIGPLLPAVNPAAYVDELLLRRHLLYQGWDPEGLLSTLPAVATTLLGVLAGHWLRTARSRSEQVVGLFVAGNIALVFGLLLHHWIPINKSLWSSSYVLFTGGVALNVLAACYWLIDCKGYRRWAQPFIAYGTNPIVAYVLSSLMEKTMLLWKVTSADGARIDLQRYVFESYFLSLASPVNASLLYASTYVLLWLGITAILYRQHIIIKM